jgi:lysophospholipase L1-like esterase
VRRPWLTAGAAFAAALAAAAGLASTAGSAPASRHAGAFDQGHWVASWGARMSSAVTGQEAVTVRNRIRPTLGGSIARAEVTNRFGTRPVRMSVTVSVPVGPGSAAQPGSIRPLSFGGGRTVVVGPGETALSDPVSTPIVAGRDLFLTVLADGVVGPITAHWSQRTSYAADGIRPEAAPAGMRPGTAWQYVDRLDVWAPEGSGAIVVVGASMALGFRTPIDSLAAWPDRLSSRLVAARYGRSVVDDSIVATRLLRRSTGQPSILAREVAQPLAIPGVQMVVLTDLINDIQQTPHVYDAALIEEGITEFARRAHEHGVTVAVTTITPYRGFRNYTVRGEACRQAVNRFIRTSPDIDVVLDFDRAIADPVDRVRLRRSYDSGDHLHPDARGQAVLADAVDLTALGGERPLN